MCKLFTQKGLVTKHLMSADLATQEDGPVGEISIQIDLFTHPGSGEHKVTVKSKFSLFLSKLN